MKKTSNLFKSALNLKTVGIVLAALLAVTCTIVLSSCANNNKSGSSSNTSQTTNTKYSADNFQKTDTCEIIVRNYGTITVGLDANAAPETVKNFKNLVSKGFYNGLTFHRIIKDFMIQGGDPKGDGTGGSETTIKGEFTSNGVNNTLAHTRGAISMARSSAKDSASSQFFIVHKTSDNNSKSLDGNYACFGYVQSGMEVVDKIAETVPVTDNNGTVNKANQPIIESITMK